ncbi:MAG: sensor histidine kinase [Pseudomonadota bacterium]
MLREGDHRIKNSLQLVTSMIRLQARRSQNPEVKHALVAASTRVDAVAHMHDALQRSIGAGADEVNLAVLIETMCGSLQAMAGDERRIRVLVDAATTTAPLSIAQPIALAVNELVINALRHAFPDEREGIVHVSVALSGTDLCVVVADDGVGLPQDYSSRTGYGMNLLRMMVTQIGGVLTAKNDGGAHWTLVVPAVLQFVDTPNDHFAR